MSRIKIEDLPVLEDLEVREIRGVFGGVIYGKKPLEYATQEEIYDDSMLKYDNLEGESLIKDEEGWADLSSFDSALKDPTKSS